MPGQQGSTATGGLFAALKNTAHTLLGMAQTRLELVGNELQLEKLRLLRQLALGLGLIFCAAISVLLLVALTTAMLWEQRLIVLATFVLVFCALAAWCYAALRRSFETSEAVFATSLSELQKDLALLKKTVDTEGTRP